MKYNVVVFWLLIVSLLCSCHNQSAIFDAAGNKRNVFKDYKVIIFKNSISCAPCFTIIDSVINYYKKNELACIITEVPQNKISLRMEEDLLNKLLPNIKNHYYTYSEKDLFDNSSSDKSVFNKFKIDKCPSVIFIKNSNNREMYDYLKIFDMSGVIKMDFVDKLKSL